MKKGVFTVANYFAPKRGVLSMHCSATADKSTGRSSLLFGLSGTGKTTLSADPKRHLIGDDEHCWSDEGIFNIEGGCYAKAINLTAESEPDIFQALRSARSYGSLGICRACSGRRDCLLAIIRRKFERSHVIRRCLRTLQVILSHLRIIFTCAAPDLQSFMERRQASSRAVPASRSPSLSSALPRLFWVACTATIYNSPPATGK
jgi:hypothetical protein